MVNNAGFGDVGSTIADGDPACGGRCSRSTFSLNLDRGVVEGLAAMAGIDEVVFDAEARLPREQLDEMQQAMVATVGDVAHIARAVQYVVTQPIELNIEELVIRPGKSLF